MQPPAGLGQRSLEVARLCIRRLAAPATATNAHRLEHDELTDETKGTHAAMALTSSAAVVSPSPSPSNLRRTNLDANAAHAVGTRQPAIYE